MEGSMGMNMSWTMGRRSWPCRRAGSLARLKLLSFVHPDWRCTLCFFCKICTTSAPSPSLSRLYPILICQLFRSRAVQIHKAVGIAALPASRTSSNFSASHIAQVVSRPHATLCQDRLRKHVRQIAQDEEADRMQV